MPFYKNDETFEIYFSEVKLPELQEVPPFYPGAILKQIGNDYELVEKYTIKLGWDKLRASDDRFLSLILGSDVANFKNLKKYNNTLRPVENIPEPEVNQTSGRYVPKLHRQVKGERLIKLKS